MNQIEVYQEARRRGITLRTLQEAKDIKHHEERVEWLESLPKLDWHDRELLRQSKAILETPYLGYRSAPEVTFAELEAALAEDIRQQAAAA